MLAELPEKIIQDVHIALSAEQRCLYDEALAMAKRARDGDDSVPDYYRNPLTLINALRKVPLYTNISS